MLLRKLSTLILVTLPVSLCGCMSVLLERVNDAIAISRQAQNVAEAVADVGIPYAGEAAAGIGVFAALLAVLQRTLMKRLEKDIAEGVAGVHKRIDTRAVETKALELKFDARGQAA